MIRKIGRLGIDFLSHLYQFSLFISNVVKNCFISPFYFKNYVANLIEIGFYSLSVVALTSLFAGMVLALQSYSGFANFSAEGAVASVVEIAITRELGPVFAGLMVAGRIGATMAANIGTMRVTEQIDALKTLSVNPFKYIIIPRVLAGITIIPILVLIADIIGIFGGFLVSVYNLGFNPYSYIKDTYESFTLIDIWIGLTKGAVFGFIITSLGCYYGYHTKGGADGVGKATTNAVVYSSIFILIFNYVITAIFF